MPPSPTVSVVSPVYHGRDTVAELVRRIQASLAGAGYSHEIILVDDACPQDSWSTIRQVCAQNPHVIGIRLTRNVGQHRALRAGLMRCRGDYVAVLDCDLQDDPAVLPALLERAREGFAVVYARRHRREPASIRDRGAGAFYRIVSLLSGAPPIDARRGMYTVLPRSTLLKLLARQDANCRYLLTLHGLSLPSADIEVIRLPRAVGGSSYGWIRLLRLSWEGMVSASARSRRWAIPVGLLVAGTGFFGVCLAAFGKLPWSASLPGWRLLCAFALAPGIVVSGLGLIARRLERSRSVPLKEEPYRIRESVNEAGLPAAS